MSQTSGGYIDRTFKAGEDLSSSQYYIVYMSGANEVKTCGANGDAIGVLQNEPESGEAAVVRIAGTTKVYSQDAATIAVGDFLTSNASGQAEEADANEEFCIGMALEASAANGDIIEMLIDRFQYMTGN